jgi:hypothetical protein
MGSVRSHSSGEPEHRGADQALVEAEGLEQLDQAAQPDAAAAGQDGIAEDRDDDRASLDAALLAEVVETFVGGRGHGVASQAWRLLF